MMLRNSGSRLDVRDASKKDGSREDSVEGSRIWKCCSRNRICGHCVLNENDNSGQKKEIYGHYPWSFGRVVDPVIRTIVYKLVDWYHVRSVEADHDTCSWWLGWGGWVKYIQSKRCSFHLTSSCQDNIWMTKGADEAWNTVHIVDTAKRSYVFSPYVVEVPWWHRDPWLVQLAVGKYVSSEK